MTADGGKLYVAFLEFAVANISTSMLTVLNWIFSYYVGKLLQTLDSSCAPRQFKVLNL